MELGKELSLKELNDYFKSKGLYKDIDGVIFQDISNNPEHYLIKGMQYKKRIQLAVFNKKTIKDFAIPGREVDSVVIMDPAVRETGNEMSDIMIRGVGQNGYAFRINGIPGFQRLVCGLFPILWAKLLYLVPINLLICANIFASISRFLLFPRFLRSSSSACAARSVF